MARRSALAASHRSTICRSRQGVRALWSAAAKAKASKIVAESRASTGFLAALSRRLFEPFLWRRLATKLLGISRDPRFIWAAAGQQGGRLRLGARQRRARPGAYPPGPAASLRRGAAEIECHKSFSRNEILRNFPAFSVSFSRAGCGGARSQGRVIFSASHGFGVKFGPQAPRSRIGSCLTGKPKSTAQ